jgi:hypothetical protein
MPLAKTRLGTRRGLVLRFRLSLERTRAVAEGQLECCHHFLLRIFFGKAKRIIRCMSNKRLNIC